MSKHPYALFRRFFQFLILCLTILVISACGSGGSSDSGSAMPTAPSGPTNQIPPNNVSSPNEPSGNAANQPGATFPQTLAITSVNTGTPIAASATVYGMTKIAVSGVDLTGTTIQFMLSGNSTSVLVPDSDSAGQFWLPISLARTSGQLSVNKDNTTVASIPLTIVPFDTSGIPGEAIQNFLQSSLFTINQRIQTLTAARQSPDLVEALQAAGDAAQQELTWVTAVMKSGSTVIAHNNDGTPVTMTANELSMLDQMALYTANLAINGGELPPVAGLSTVTKILNFLIPSAYAQTSSCIPNRSLAGIPEDKRQSVANDIAWCQANAQTANEEAFANNMKAAGEGLSFVGNAALAISTLGASFVVQGGFVVASEVFNSVGTFASHYGDGVAFISFLKDKNYPEARKKFVEIIGDELLKKATKGWASFGLDKLGLKDELERKLLENFAAKIGKEPIKTKLKNLIAGFKLHNQGVSLCGDGTPPAINPADGIGHCP